MQGSGVRVQGSVSTLVCQIERVVERNFRRTRSAKFQRLDGWFICEGYFDHGQPKIWMRSKVEDLEEAAIVSVGIQMAIEWMIEESARGGNYPPDPCSLIPDPCEPEASHAAS
jgi:hypothetical protein